MNMQKTTNNKGPTSEASPFSLLMLLAEQIVYRLHGVESAQRYFYEDCAPVAHSAIPESRQLQCLQFLTSLRLR